MIIFTKRKEDASINKAPNRFTTRGLQLPEVVQTILDANTTIPQNNSDVNRNYAQNLENNAKSTESVVAKNLQLSR